MGRRVAQGIAELVDDRIEPLVEVNEHHTVIDFDGHGRRTFATRLVVLQATNEPAPNKPAKTRAKKKKIEKVEKAEK